jgi:hypothetical protein
MELEIRPFTDEDEPLDVRGQPMNLTSTTVRVSKTFTSDFSVEQQSAPWNAPPLTNGGSSETAIDDGALIARQVSATKKKKRKSRPVSDDATGSTMSPGSDVAVNGTNGSKKYLCADVGVDPKLVGYR